LPEVAFLPPNQRLAIRRKGDRSAVGRDSQPSEKLAAGHVPHASDSALGMAIYRSEHLAIVRKGQTRDSTLSGSIRIMGYRVDFLPGGHVPQVNVFLLRGG